jgi:peptide deformylase
MALLKIARMGHPVLLAPALAVADPCAPEIAVLVTDMVETLADADGAGLAAPQVHVGKRVIVFHVSSARRAASRYRDAALDEETDTVPLTVLINPEIELLGEETEEAFESCLSLPGMTGRVARHVRIRYRGLDLAGETIERQAEGFHARLVQHECDHLDGILYPQRMDGLASFGYMEEMTASRNEDAANGDDEQNGEQNGDEI